MVCVLYEVDSLFYRFLNYSDNISQPIWKQIPATRRKNFVRHKILANYHISAKKPILKAFTVVL